jgi:ribosomal protein S18 acetylase RimI-like enzyme
MVTKTLQFRLATAGDHERLIGLATDSFAPISWYRDIEDEFGLLNGVDWRGRWRLRMKKIFETEVVLVGESGDEIVAFCTGKIEPETALAFIDVLAVDASHQRQGLGRQMLRAMLGHLKKEGAVHAYLDCLTSNEAGNELYRSEGFKQSAGFAYWFVKIP